MNQCFHVRLNLILIRNPLLAKWLGITPTLRIIEYSRANWEITILMLLAELHRSTTPKYSSELLLILGGVPSEVLETNEYAKNHFSVGVSERDKFRSVKEAIKGCEAALRMCLRADS